MLRLLFSLISSALFASLGLDFLFCDILGPDRVSVFLDLEVRERAS